MRKPDSQSIPNPQPRAGKGFQMSDAETDLGANCPTCGVRIRIGNAGGYRTYCDKCADAAADKACAETEARETEYLRNNDRLRQIENQQFHNKP